MLRVWFKKDVTREKVESVLNAIGFNPYNRPGPMYVGSSEWTVVDYNHDPLDVTSIFPNELPVEMVERVTLHETIARFFRNDGQYRYRECRITAEVVRTDKAGAPVQSVHITGPSVGEVVQAYRLFRNQATASDVLKLEENWGGSTIGPW